MCTVGTELSCGAVYGARLGRGVYQRVALEGVSTSWWGGGVSTSVGALEGRYPRVGKGGGIASSAFRLGVPQIGGTYSVQFQRGRHSEFRSHGSCRPMALYSAHVG